MKHHLLFALAALLFLSAAANSDAGLKIYYIRHGESGANVLDQWKDQPKDRWPSYVGNEDAFSPRGEMQVNAVPDKLAKYHFDFIAVSPKWRARQTILGYLKVNNLKGEIWPELEEISTDPTQTMALMKANELPKPAPQLFLGEPIKLPKEEHPYFTLRPKALKRYKFREENPKEYDADCIASLQQAIDLIKKRYEEQDKSILLVGHGNSGKLLLHLLTNSTNDTLPAILNTGVWMVEEQPDKNFKLMIYNDLAILPPNP